MYNKEIKNSSHLFGVSLLRKTSSVTSPLKASTELGVLKAKIYIRQTLM